MASDEESARSLTVTADDNAEEVMTWQKETPPEEGSGVPQFWRFFAWGPRVRPRILLWAVLVGWAAVLAGGLAGILLGGESACEARTATALNQYGYVVERIQEQVTIRTLPVVSLATFVRQTPYFPELATKFDSIASDLLEGESAVANIQLVPGGVVSAAYPPGNEGAIGHDLFEDPNRRGDVLRAVAGAPSMSISNPVILAREGQSGRAVFARYPVFVDGPVANRTQAFGVPDAHECGDLCYGDPENVFWGLTTALVDFDELLVSSGLTTLEEEGACFVLRTGRVFQSTDQVSSNSTIFQSQCVASRPEVLTVDVPNDQWFLEIGTPGDCTPWVTPVAIVFAIIMLALLALLLLFVHQSLTNRVLTELRHAAEVGQLRERQQQIAREEASLGSDAVRLLVASLSKIHTALTPIICQTQMDPTVNGNTSIMRAPSGGELNSMMSIANLHKTLGKGAVLVTSKVHQLPVMQAANAKACSAMLTALRDLVQDHVGEYHGECVAMIEENYVIRFKEVVQAVSFALKLRKALLESTWPEQILALPGCGSKKMAVALQADAKGPQLQSVIDLVPPLLPYLHFLTPHAVCLYHHPRCEFFR
jgi:sensor domain CHASE-containing protein